MPDVKQVPTACHEEARFWRVFEGQVLQGFPLDAFLGRTDSVASFATRLPGSDKLVLMEVVRYGAPGWERLSSSWTIAKELRHPHLVRVHACGIGKLDGLNVAYAVSDQPDEKLADVLAERPLTEEEGRDLLLNCAEALQYLHHKGFVHTHVRPGAVVSVDESIQLSCNYLVKAGEAPASSAVDAYSAPEFATEGYTAAADIWSLGVTILECLTGSLPATEEARAAGPRTAYASVLRRCLATRPEIRCTARQILSSLNNAKPVKLDSEQEDGDYVTRPQGYSSPQSRFLPQEPVPPSILQRAKYAIPLVCLPLLAAVWLASSPSHRTALEATGVAASTKKPEQGDADRASQNESAAKREALKTDAVKAPEPRPVANYEKPSPMPVAGKGKKAESAKSSVVKPAVVKPAVVKPEGTKVGGSAGGGLRTWSVVVYTYAHEDSAQRKADEINRKWPELSARVIEAKNGRSHLVVLGSGLDKDAALKLREQALAAKLPRDSYVQNF